MHVSYVLPGFRNVSDRVLCHMRRRMHVSYVLPGFRNVSDRVLFP